MTDPVERLRAANPVTEPPPRPTEELWRALDVPTEPPPGAHRARSSARRSRTARRPGLGAAVTAISVAVALGIAVAALVVIKPGRSVTGKASRPLTATTRPSGGAVLPRGAGIGPQRGGRDAGPGAPIAGTERLVVRSPDPRGGLSWGLRSFETTRGQTCLQVGRVQDGAIGVIGEAGAWADDHHFHPISPDAAGADACAETDGAGLAFENVTQDSELVSGAAGLVELGSQGCGITGEHGQACRRANLRIVQFGLLGPDATGVTALTPDGRTHTLPTVGDDGAYLIVEPATPRLCRAAAGQSTRTGCGREVPGGYSLGPSLTSGLVTAVHYRARPTCRVPAPPPVGSPAGTSQGSCPPVGYRAPRTAHLTAALLAAPITTRELGSRHEVEISFTAHVAVTGDNSYYEYTLDAARSPSCSSQTGDTTEGTLIRAGRRVTLTDQIRAGCAGVLHGTVAYVPNVGPGGSGYPLGPNAVHVRSIVVGRFSVDVR